MQSDKSKTMAIRTAPCPAVKSFVFVFLTFVSLFSLHAVAKHVIDGSLPIMPEAGANPVADVVEQQAAVTGDDQGAGKPEGEFTLSRPVYAGTEATEVTALWNPLSKTYLTEEQTRLLMLAFDIGYKHGGIQQAKLVQATMMQETIAGLMGRIGHLSAPVGKRSYGVMQVKVSAASDVLRLHHELGEFKSEEELIAKLITDDEFNINIASLFMMHLRKFTDTDAQALMAYNIGLSGAKRQKDHSSFAYVQGVRRFYQEVILPFNEKYRAEYSSSSPV